MYLLFVPPLEFVFVSNFILSVYLCLCTIFVYSAILGKPYKSTVISNNNNILLCIIDNIILYCVIYNKNTMCYAINTWL